jgi:hypothetical protein
MATREDHTTKLLAALASLRIWTIVEERANQLTNCKPLLLLRVMIPAFAQKQSRSVGKTIRSYGPSQALAPFQLALAAEFTSFESASCSARPLIPSLSNPRYRDSSAGAYSDAERL